MVSLEQARDKLIMWIKISDKLGGTTEDYVREAHRLYTAAAEQMVADSKRRIIELQAEVKHERDRRLVSDAKRDNLRQAIEDVLRTELAELRKSHIEAGRRATPKQPANS